MDVLESVVAVLSLLQEFTNLLACEKEVSVSAIRPLLHHIQDTTLANKPEDNNLLHFIFHSLFGGFNDAGV